MREELWEPDKTYDITDHPDIFRSRGEDMAASRALQATLKQLSRLVNSSQPEKIIRLLDDVVPGSAIHDTPPPADLTDVV